MKVGDLIRYDPGPNWSEQEKADHCAIGLILCVGIDGDNLGIQWCSHNRNDFKVHDKHEVEVISESG